MLRVGITGGIGSGKSTVTKIFHTLGIPIYDADTAAKKVMNTQPTVKKSIIQLFGEDAYINDQLNTSFLSNQVFNDKSLLGELNAIVHPATFEDCENWMDSQHTPYAIKEAALIFESGARAYLDYVIGVTAPRSLRLFRAMKRDGTDQKNVEARMNRQMSDTIKMKLCDFVITNDEQQAIIPQVLAIHEQLIILSSSN